MSITIARVVGARPQFMQVPAVWRAMSELGFEQRLIHTGQHYDADMSDVFFQELGLPAPHANLSVGSHAQGKATGIMMERLEAYLIEERPDGVLLDGDTNSTMAAALAAAKLHIPVFHIEGGLRDWDRRRPEEVNRVVTDHVAALNFAPIPLAFENLKREGLESTARLSGDVLCDVYCDSIGHASREIVERLNLVSGGYHLMTLHRPENTDMAEYERFSAIISAVTSVGKPVVFPVHPRTRPILDRYIAEHGAPASLLTVNPVSYNQMLGLTLTADCVFTDSGGLPREAVWAGRRCVMLFRMDTWHTLLEKGWAQIGKTDRQSILTAFEKAQPAPAEDAIALFGGGKAGLRVASEIQAFFRRK